MPTSTAMKFGVGMEGLLKGTATNAGTTCPEPATAIVTNFSGTGKQVYETFTTPLVIAPSGTTTLNLITGLTNPLGESISGSAKFVHVHAFWIYHDAASLSSGITAFGGASLNLFQGPLGATSTVTLAPGYDFAFHRTANLTGWVVAAGAKNIDITNNDATALHTATVKVLILGTTT